MIIFVKFFYYLSDKQPKLAYSIGKFLVSIIFFLGFRRKVVMKNLMIAFPGNKLSWYRKKALKTYNFFAFQTIYTAHFYKHPQRFLEILHIKNYSSYKALKQQNKPLFFFTAHFGLWELITLFFGLKGLKALVLYQKIHDRRINDFILNFRDANTPHVYIPRNDIKNLLKYIKSGYGLGLLVDQRPREKGKYAKFFKRDLRFYYTPFRLVKKYNAIPLFVYAYYEKGHFILDIFDNVGSTPEEILDNYTGQLEKIIKEHPEQYFWFHNRWKNVG